MARKSGFVRRGNTMVRETRWVAIAETDTTLAAASTAVLFTGFGATVLALRPFTIVRMRGILGIRTDQVVASELQHAALSLAVVSDQALAIGVTAVPTPSADRASDAFMLYEEIASFFTFASNIGIQTQGMTLKEFGSKAMRKVEQGFDAAMCVETSVNSAGCIVSKAGRMLIKLH